MTSAYELLGFGPETLGDLSNDGYFRSHEMFEELVQMASYYLFSESEFESRLEDATDPTGSLSNDKYSRYSRMIRELRSEMRVMTQGNGYVPESGSRVYVYVPDVQELEYLDIRPEDVVFLMIRDSVAHRDLYRITPFENLEYLTISLSKPDGSDPMQVFSWPLRYLWVSRRSRYSELKIEPRPPLEYVCDRWRHSDETFDLTGVKYFCGNLEALNNSDLSELTEIEHLDLTDHLKANELDRTKFPMLRTLVATIEYGRGMTMRKSLYDLEYLYVHVKSTNDRYKFVARELGTLHIRVPEDTRLSLDVEAHRIYVSRLRAESRIEILTGHMIDYMETTLGPMSKYNTEYPDMNLIFVLKSAGFLKDQPDLLFEEFRGEPMWHRVRVPESVQIDFGDYSEALIHLSRLIKEIDSSTYPLPHLSHSREELRVKYLDLFEKLRDITMKTIASHIYDDYD